MPVPISAPLWRSEMRPLGESSIFTKQDSAPVPKPFCTQPKPTP